LADSKAETTGVDSSQQPSQVMQKTLVATSKSQSQQQSPSLQSGRSEADINFAIKSLQEETQQIFELIEMERTYGSEVSTQLKQIIMPLNLSYHIKPESISKTDSSISDVVLTPQGMVCVFNNQGSMISRPLESFQSDVLIRILLEVIPEIKVMLNEKRQKMSGRVMTLERVAKELRKVPALVPPTKGGSVARSNTSDQQGGDSRMSSSSSTSSGASQDALKSAIGEKQ
jgi:hypothetical protein